MAKQRKTCQISRIERFSVDENGEKISLDVNEPINLSREEARKVLSREDITDEILNASEYLRIKRKKEREKKENETSYVIRIQRRKEEELRIMKRQLKEAREVALIGARRKAKQERRKQIIDELTTEFIASKKKQGLGYREIRKEALDFLSAVNYAQEEESRFSKEGFDIITSALSNAVDIATNKYNSMFGEFAPVEQAKTLSK